MNECTRARSVHAIRPNDRYKSVRVHALTRPT